VCFEGYTKNGSRVSTKDEACLIAHCGRGTDMELSTPGEIGHQPLVSAAMEIVPHSAIVKSFAGFAEFPPRRRFCKQGCRRGICSAYPICPCQRKDLSPSSCINFRLDLHFLLPFIITFLFHSSYIQKGSGRITRPCQQTVCVVDGISSRSRLYVSWTFLSSCR
jgi:hypothetical protein